MDKRYSQSKALGAITKASFIANLKNPQSLVFSLLFPLIFVFIFGAFGGGGFTKFNIALSQGCDTSNILYQTIAKQPFIVFKKYTDTAKMRQDLEKGNLTGILTIQKTASGSDTSNALPHFNLTIKSTSASSPDLSQLVPLLENIADKLEKKLSGNRSDFVAIKQDIYNVRQYKQIDFVLPGQIGFSLLFSTLFGIAFTFFNLREQLVLKRFYATPVNRLNILLGIGFSRIFFQLINVLVLISVGHFFIGFTLAHGFATFIEMVLMSVLFLLMLMGVGLIFSSIVKNDTMIPLMINIFSLPQMLLSGTFFPITVFPVWLQNCCKILPLTHFNLAMRKISFEGTSILECWQNIGVLGLWIVAIYFVVWKVFKWE
ncbi:ABC transporter permease [Parasediminibacterium sp. JCM 36343]|uniref:ABC transporter permease n=1 Tax=Parasediminibacterium sp. JCM 36343 TaxID=3374279 RepID=UPI00397B92CB